MFGLYGKLKTHPGQREVLLGYLLKAAEVLKEFEGCYLYIISNATDDEDTIWISEVWRSREDHQASLALDAVKDLITAARPLVAAPPEGFEVMPQGGKGL